MKNMTSKQVGGLSHIAATGGSAPADTLAFASIPGEKNGRVVRLAVAVPSRSSSIPTSHDEYEPIRKLAVLPGIPD
ncbi:hypothetical protein [Marinobacter salicampi]|uniref:hypothetical protein n=1 Tax=Marinobacter salicampi TaxID=435907 RepID=UPI00140A4D4D|nr:hypothetical protein [Marinobacter salicampi]